MNVFERGGQFGMTATIACCWVVTKRTNDNSCGGRVWGMLLCFCAEPRSTGGVNKYAPRAAQLRPRVCGGVCVCVCA